MIKTSALNSFYSLICILNVLKSVKTQWNSSKDMSKYQWLGRYMYTKGEKTDDTKRDTPDIYLAYNLMCFNV